MRKLSILVSIGALTALLSGSAFSWNYWRFPQFWRQPYGRNRPGEPDDGRVDGSSHTYSHESNVGQHADADNEAGGGWIALGILALIALVVVLVLVL